MDTLDTLRVGRDAVPSCGCPHVDHVWAETKNPDAHREHRGQGGCYKSCRGWQPMYIRHVCTKVYCAGKSLLVTVAKSSTTGR
jgi:hypothetical protein